MPEKTPPLKVVLISTYELGRQPFGLASPAAWLRREGFAVHCADCAIDPLPVEAIREADIVGFYVPMHTATRLAVQFLRRVKEINPTVHICFYGLYAPMNENFLRRRGVDNILGGEFEEGLVSVCRRLREEKNASTPANGSFARQAEVMIDYKNSRLQEYMNSHSGQVEALVSLKRQQFIIPERNGLPALSRYAQLCCQNRHPKITGYVEATRGCKYLCRHCPVVPVYNGRFRIVQKEVVLADIRQQVEAGAQHITFGDPDFLNGPGHVLPIVKALHQEFPGLSYDVTIKVEHLLKYRHHLPLLRDTGCVLVTTAVESVDNRVLQLLDKGHTREDFIRVAGIFDEIGLALNPTFVPFTPWITLDGYRDLLTLLNDLNLTENVSPVQLAIRLLIPQGSRLLELPETRRFIGPFNEELLSYQWAHPDPKVDQLQQQVMALVGSAAMREKKRSEIFTKIWNAVNEMLDSAEPLPKPRNTISRAAIPYLNEPWYC